MIVNESSTPPVTILPEKDRLEKQSNNLTYSRWLLYNLG